MKVIKFEAEWCGPCQAMKPTWESFTQQVTDTEFEVVDIDEDPGKASEYTVRAVPTIIFEKDGEVQDTLVGMQTLDKLVKTANKVKGE